MANEIGIGIVGGSIAARWANRFLAVIEDASASGRRKPVPADAAIGSQ